MKHFTFLSILTFTFFFTDAQSRYELNKGWKLMPLAQVKEDGLKISTTSYPTTTWKPAIVPGTVLSNQLALKEIPDPFYGMNNKTIPDIYFIGRDYYTYWFVNDFTEAFPVDGRQVWLTLRGVNYSCNVFLNGHKLNDSTHKGMFLRQTYNITPHLQRSGKNRLAVIVYPPDPVGNPNGGQGGDGTIAKNVTHQYVAGWDWIQPIRDRNTGIWDKVIIERTGDINIKDPHIITVVNGKRNNTGAQAPAVIKVAATLHNTSSKEVRGVLEYTLEGNRIFKNVTVRAGQEATVQLPDLTLKNPKLWWPNGYGQQHLYKINLKFTAANNKRLSDDEAITFGVREITRQWNATTLSSQYLVNGQKIFLKGGNWIISDAMLRFTDARYDAEIRFHRDMRLNLIRIWGGALLERPEFYEACDRYGLLVMQDLWITGDCNGRWNDRMKLESREVRREYPDDHALFLASAADGIKMIRNHASLAMWCGGNEYTPPDDILKTLKDSVFPSLDPTRYFFDYSNSDSMSTNILRGGGDGPYNIQPIDTFWKFRTYPFNSEIGSVGTGDMESLKRFIPEQNLLAPEYSPPASPGARPVVKVDSVWDYHKYIGYNQYISQYGELKGVEDFAMKAQLINYQQYRALIEGFTGHMWEWYTGVIIWKTQNPWTALRGQMYDYYLDPNACLYGLRTGGEGVHLMYNTYEGSVMLANNNFHAYEMLRVIVRAYDMDGKSQVVAQFNTDIEASSVKRLQNIKQQVDSLRRREGTFLSLELMYKTGATISKNIYWLEDATGNYSGLNRMKPAELQVSSRQVAPGKIAVTLTNKRGGPLAFFNRVSLIDADTKERMLPAFYSDNYVTVLPGEQRRIVIDYKGKVVKPQVTVEGWNWKKTFHAVQ
jgi:mannosylglycoprotein endo-beta-mannosidase